MAVKPKEVESKDANPIFSKIYNVLGKIEGNKALPYYDSIGLITVGVGYEIERTKIINNKKYNAFREKVLKIRK